MDAVKETASQLAKLELKVQKYKKRVRKAKENKKRRQRRHGRYYSPAAATPAPTANRIRGAAISLRGR